MKTAKNTSIFLISYFIVATLSLHVSCKEESKKGSGKFDIGSSTTLSDDAESKIDSDNKSSNSNHNETKSFSDKPELDIDLNDLKPLLQMQYGLTSEEIDELIKFSEQKEALKAQGLLDSEEGKKYWAEVDRYLTQLEQTERNGKSSIQELRDNIFRKPPESQDPIARSVQEGIKKIPKEFLRADGLVQPSFIEDELRKEEFWQLVEKTMVERQMTFNPDAVDEETLARVFNVTKEEVKLMKATPAFAKPQTASEAEEYQKNPLSKDIQTHLKSGKASESFKGHMARLQQRRTQNSEAFLKKAQRAKKQFYDLNPNWYNDRNGLSETYLSNQGAYVFLPLGKLSFADRIVSHYKGKNSRGANAHDALGEPNFDENKSKNMSNLGLRGVLILEFVDNVLIDVNGPDLFVFEIGAIESTKLEISTDGTNWTEVGEISGGTAQVDIGPHIRKGQSFNYVRFTDLETQSMLPGADIDAVAAIGGALRMSLDSAVLFDTGKHELKPKGVAAVQELAAQMQNIPKGTITVEGHTDDVGSDQTNLELSKKRAASVAAALKTSIGNSNFKWKEVGYGESNPLVPNDSDENRQKNRRVEILVTPF